jgi:hypothetical protein
LIRIGKGRKHTIVQCIKILQVQVVVSCILALDLGTL